MQQWNGVISDGAPVSSCLRVELMKVIAAGIYSLKRYSGEGFSPYTSLRVYWATLRRHSETSVHTWKYKILHQYCRQSSSTSSILSASCHWAHNCGPEGSTCSFRHTWIATAHIPMDFCTCDLHVAFAGKVFTMARGDPGRARLVDLHE